MTEAKTPESETTSINLHNDVTIANSKGTFRFRKGQGVRVPKDMASDIERIDYDAEQSKAKLHVKQTYEVNSGTIGVGGES